MEKGMGEEKRVTEKRMHVNGYISLFLNYIFQWHQQIYCIQGWFATILSVCQTKIYYFGERNEEGNEMTAT